MRFENVNILTELIMDIIKDMRYCWCVSYDDDDCCSIMQYMLWQFCLSLCILVYFVKAATNIIKMFTAL